MPAGVLGRPGARERHRRRRVDAVQRELPRDDPGDGLDGGGGRRWPCGSRRARRRRRRPVLNPWLCPPTHDVGDAAGPALPDPAEAVDDEVVGDVVVALDVLVVRLDRAQHCGHLGGRVGVARHGVVDDGELEVGGGGRVLASAAGRPSSPRERMPGAPAAPPRRRRARTRPRSVRSTTTSWTSSAVDGRRARRPRRRRRRRATPARCGAPGVGRSPASRSGASPAAKRHLEPGRPRAVDPAAHEHRTVGRGVDA